MTTGGEGPQQPPAPGWWLASDGNWYPPQPPQPAYGAPQAPPVQAKSNRGCLIGLAIAGALLVSCGGAVAFAIWKFADTVEDAVDGVTVGEVECPTADDISDIVGYDVNLATSGSIVVASGCGYTSAEASGGAGVSIVSGSGLIADEVLAELENTAQSNGVEATSIDVGDDGRAFGAESRSEAATKADGRVVTVQIFAEGGESIGDKRDAAVEILEAFIELNGD